MIKVGIECESIEDDSWGIGRSIQGLLKELAGRPELANEFKFFLYFKKTIPNFQYLQNPLFVKRVAQISSFSLYYYFWLPLRRLFDPLDLMFFPNYMLPFGFVGKTMGTLTEDVYHAMHSSWLPWRYKLAYRIFVNNTARRATKINVYSHTSCMEVSRLFGIDQFRIFVNHLGVEHSILENFRSVGAAAGYILYVGQAFPRRHLKETILAFKKIAPEFPGLKFVAIGIDKYNPPIIASLVDENIIYKERVSDEELDTLYAGAKIFVYISDTEAFGLPPLEALAHGTPSVLGDTDISREIFGSLAFYVKKPFDVESIASTIKSALVDRAVRQTIMDNRLRVLKHYTWAKNADRFLALCRDIRTVLITTCQNSRTVCFSRDIRSSTERV